MSSTTSTGAGKLAFVLALCVAVGGYAAWRTHGRGDGTPVPEPRIDAAPAPSCLPGRAERVGLGRVECDTPDALIVTVQWLPHEVATRTIPITLTVDGAARTYQGDPADTGFREWLIGSARTHVVTVRADNPSSGHLGCFVWVIDGAGKRRIVDFVTTNKGEPPYSIVLCKSDPAAVERALNR